MAMPYGPVTPIQGVEENLEVRILLYEPLDQAEVEDLLHEIHIVLRRVDDLDRQRLVLLGADMVDVDVGDVRNLVGFEVPWRFGISCR